MIGLSLGFGGAIAVAGAKLATDPVTDGAWLGCESDTAWLGTNGLLASP